MDISGAFSGNTIRAWGRNVSVGTSLEEVYGYDQALEWGSVLTSSGSRLDVTSSSANDTSAGTGARTVKIVGLDANYKLYDETVTMNGNTIVTTAGYFTDVFGADVVSHGTGLTNAGDIHIVKSGTGGSYTTGVPGTLTGGVAKMLAGWSTTQNGHFTAPAGGGYYKLQDAVLGSITQSATFVFALQDLGSTDQTSHVCCTYTLGTSMAMQINCAVKDVVIGPKQSFRIRALAASAGASVTANFVMKSV